MKTSVVQRHALHTVAVLKQRLDDQVRSVEYTVRDEIAQRTGASRAEYEAAVVEADRLRVPKAQIALAVGTTNPKPIREIIRRAASARKSVPNDRYATGGSPNSLFVRLDGDDLASACESTGWTVAEAVDGGFDRAEFRVASEFLLVAETPSFVVEFGRLNPIVFWVRRNSFEALAWWEEQRL